MRDMPYKITYKFALISTWLVILLIAGCSTGPEKKFVPPVYPTPPDEPRFIYERTLRSSADIVELTASQKLKIFATGTTEGSFGLAKPYGIAVKEGRIYVTDTVQRAVLLFNFPEGTFKYIGTEGTAVLSKPLGIDIDNAGNIYVVDNTLKSVFVFDKDGNFQRNIGNKEDLDRPSGVAVSPDGTKVYVVDTGGVDSDSHHLVIYDNQTGELIKIVGKRGPEQGDFNLPLQAATAPDGTVYVVDGGNFRVQSFTPNGDFKLTFGKVGKIRGDFSRPKGIAVDKDGHVYVADAAFGNFQIFNDQGQLMLHVGARHNDGGPGHYMLPAGIDVDEDGRIYFIDQFFRKVDVFRPYSLKEEEGYIGTLYREKIKKQQAK